jgi:hypothetical protein
MSSHRDVPLHKGIKGHRTSHLQLATVAGVFEVAPVTTV